MLNEKEIIELLKKSLEKYILYLINDSLDYIICETEIKSYIRVLNREDLKIRYLDINNARNLLKRILMEV